MHDWPANGRNSFFPLQGRPPYACPSFPARQDSPPRDLREQNGLIQYLSGSLQWLVWQPGAFSWPPKASLLQPPSKGAPHCDTGSGRLAIDRASLHPSALGGLTGGRRWASSFAAVSPAHRPAHWPSGQNSIQSTRISHTTLACWGHPGVINIPPAFSRPVSPDSTRCDMAHG